MATLQSHRIVQNGLTIILVLAYGAAAAGAEFAGGTGEPNDPYQIATAGQLAGIGEDRELLTRHYVLINDIDLDPNLPGGKVFSQGLIAPEIHNVHGMISGYFKGVFDGGGHVIRNLTIHSDKALAAGLFGYIDSPSQIKNLGLRGVDIRRSGAGRQAIVGGGLVAFNAGGAILGCYATGSVVETYQFTPYPWDANDRDCIGGLIGQNNGLVHGCYAIVDVQGDGIVGGLVGVNTGAVRFSFAAGAPYGSGWVGGLAGRNDAGTVVDSYWDSETGVAATGDQGTARTTAEMMARETYEPWVYTGAWTLNDGRDYPHLSWEKGEGTPIGDIPPAYAGGSGAPDDPFQIATAEQLIAMGRDSSLRDKHFVLVADLDLDPNLPGGKYFHEAILVMPVPPAGRGGRPCFDGSFDGGGHVIRNCTIYAREYGLHAALFHAIGPNGRVWNLHLQEVTISGVASNFAGHHAPLAGENAGLIVDCSATGRVVAGFPGRIGAGLVGQNTGIMIRCWSSCDVLGSVAGGLVGTNSGLVQYCSSGGSVLGDTAGGLVGTNAGTVRECYSLATALASTACGGVAGLNSGEILNCYSRGLVLGDGLAGKNTGAVTSSYGTAVSRPAPDPHLAMLQLLTIQASTPDQVRYVYYLDPAKADTPTVRSISYRYGVALSPSQMTQRGSFAGFDFQGETNDGTEDHWFMPAAGYPVLAWQTQHTGLVGVPDVSGLTPEQARALLELAGFGAVEIEQDWFGPRTFYVDLSGQFYDASIPAGQAACVRPAAYVSPGTPVRIVVSQGMYDFATNAGDGSEANPYQIATAGQLDRLHDYIFPQGRHFILTADLDLTHRIYQRAVIGGLAGTFNGGGHSIRGMRIEGWRSHGQRVGLFGMIGPTGAVHDLTLVGAVVDSQFRRGLLASENHGRVERCNVSGQVSGAGAEVGGLVGINEGQILDSQIGAAVWAYPMGYGLGGLVGVNHGFIRGCCARGIDVYGDAGMVGGLVGHSYGALACIEACYAQGSVRGRHNVGGLLGSNGDLVPAEHVRYEEGEVRDCYAACSVTVTLPMKGGSGYCVGYAYPSAVQTGCFFFAGADGSLDNGLGTPLTDAQMRQQASFGRWDFVDTWTICEGRDYPRLRWECVNCEVGP